MCQNPLENTFRAIRSYSSSNNNPTVGQFVDTLKTGSINGLACRSVQGSNCEDDGATLMDNPQSLFRVPDVSQPNPFTSNGTENSHDPSDSFHFAEQIQDKLRATVHAGDMEVFQ
jgi:hypothetical protein